MRSDEWIMVRVPRWLHADLMRRIAELEKQVDLCRMDRWWEGERLSLWQLIERLLDLDEAKRERAEKSARGRVERNAARSVMVRTIRRLIAAGEPDGMAAFLAELADRMDAPGSPAPTNRSLCPHGGASS